MFDELTTYKPEETMNIELVRLTSEFFMILIMT